MSILDIDSINKKALPSNFAKIHDYKSRTQVQQPFSENSSAERFKSSYQAQMQIPKLDTQTVTQERQRILKNIKKPHIVLGLDSSKTGSPRENEANQTIPSIRSNDQQLSMKQNLGQHHFNLGYRDQQLNDYNKEREEQQQMIKDYFERNRKYQSTLKDRIKTLKGSSIILSNIKESPFHSRKNSDLKPNVTFESTSRADSGLRKTSIKFTDNSVQEWSTNNQRQMNQAKEFHYMPIGKYERSRQYKETQFVLGVQTAEIEENVRKPNQTQLLTYEDSNRILEKMQTQHIYLGNDTYLPNESSTNQAYKPLKQNNELNQLPIIEPRNNLNLFEMNENSDPPSPSSSYAMNHNSQSGEVNLEFQRDAQQKVLNYKQRTQKHQIVLGEDQSQDLNQSIGMKDYTKYEDIDKSYLEQLRQKEENKSMFEKQNYNIGFEKITTPHQPKNIIHNRNVSKEDNSELFRSLKKSYVHLGSENDTKPSQSWLAYTIKDPLQNFSIYQNQRKEFELIKQQGKNGYHFNNKSQKSNSYQQSPRTKIDQ